MIAREATSNTGAILFFQMLKAAFMACLLLVLEKAVTMPKDSLGSKIVNQLGKMDFFAENVARAHKESHGCDS